MFMNRGLLAQLLKTREGLIAVIGSTVYGLMGLFAQYAPTVASVSGFYGWFALFMPIPLFLFFVKVGGFRKNFESNWFDTGIMIGVALIPVILKIESLIKDGYFSL